MDGGKDMRIRLRVSDSRITRNIVKQRVFTTTEVPFIRIFGDTPVYVALCKEKDTFKLMRTDTKEKLKKEGIEVQTPIELKARRSIFMRRLDRHERGDKDRACKQP